MAYEILGWTKRVRIDTLCRLKHSLFVCFTPGRTYLRRHSFFASPTPPADAKSVVLP